MSKTTEAAKPAAKPELFKVTLLKAHTHAGKPLAAGDSIDVTGPEREFLRAVGVVANDQAEGTAPAAQ
ncbi:DUF7210 family protein [Pseudomonas sp.]|uniref:DUF7210 family protein n=1 Tax=Pseudomonas sp. TaxID=306 RepID=UPI003D11CFEB